jgi:hypothetical protein
VGSRFRSGLHSRETAIALSPNVSDRLVLGDVPCTKPERRHCAPRDRNVAIRLVAPSKRLELGLGGMPDGHDAKLQFDTLEELKCELDHLRTFNVILCLINTVSTYSGLARSARCKNAH